MLPDRVQMAMLNPHNAVVRPFDLRHTLECTGLREVALF